MKVTYLYHSGFLVETEENYYVFDYYKGRLPELLAAKPIFVFASHFHADHYNPIIFDLLKEQGMKQIYGIFSWDIAPKRIPQNLEALRVKADGRYVLPGSQSLQTLHSTDEGVAFLLTEPEGVIYHAGDLNDWVWAEESKAYNENMTKRYQTEIDKLADKQIHVAFLPLDPRQESDYAKGILYFLEHIKADKVYPMHYWEKPQIIGNFIREYPQYSPVIQLTEEIG